MSEETVAGDSADDKGNEDENDEQSESMAGLGADDVTVEDWSGEPAKSEVLRHLPDKPGRQEEQRIRALVQAHRTHLALAPLHGQHLVAILNFL